MYLSPAKIAKKILGDKWKTPPHIELIDSLLLKMSERNIFRLIVNIPPRHGKSELISKFFPFWYLGNFPEHNVFLVTYQNKFAEQWGKRIKELFIEYGEELFGIKLNSKDASAKSLRIQNYGGTLYCVGSAGALTGRGANLIVVDDPIKNDKEATSQLQRENLWHWFKATLFTRLEPNAVVALVMTRWNEDDLVGRILESYDFYVISDSNISNLNAKGREDLWFLLKLPAIATEQDTLGRKAGEPLWNERFNIVSLNERQKVLGDFWFSALYQQEPKPATGKIFRREKFRYFTKSSNYFELAVPEKSGFNKEFVFSAECSVFATVDLAIKTNQQSDFTVAIVFAVSKDKKIFVLEVVREKFDAADHLSFLESLFFRWKPRLIGIESVQYQASLLQQARRLGLPIKELRADRDKISRSLPIASMMDAGVVFFRRDANWLETFESELIEFPNGKHDDQVDAFAYIAQLIEPISSAKVYGSSKNKPKGYQQIEFLC